jgi:large subunit ribosomal protein L21
VEYAIIETGGKQYRVTPGQVVKIPSVAQEVGSTIRLNVLATGDGERFQVGTVEGLEATIVQHGRDKKVIVFKKKRRKQYKKTIGHRQDFTAVRIGPLGGDTE